jgi:solute carrier family 25 oxoglutarate transporter 11
MSSNNHKAAAPNNNMFLNFFFGGFSGSVATLFVQPIDMIKVRIQLLSEKGDKKVSLVKVGKDIIKQDGFLYLYKGLDSAIMRQVFYGTTRLGLFYSFLDLWKKKNPEPTVFQKAISSIAAGGIAAFVSNPADLILIRMQADGTLPPEQRRNYKNVFSGVSRVISEEGFTKLWTGCIPTITRACIINFALLAPFEEFKFRLKNIIAHDFTRTVVSSMMASFIGSFASLPFDNSKTKLQKMKADQNGNLPYTGIVDALKKTVKNEGFARLWVGFPTYYVRIGPHVIITLVLNDTLRKMYLK